MTSFPIIKTSHLVVVPRQKKAHHSVYVEFSEEWMAIEFFKKLPVLLHGSRTRIGFGPTCVNISLHDLTAGDFVSIYNHLERKSREYEGMKLNG